MKIALLILPILALAGCDKPVTHFKVHAPGAVAAELQICGPAAAPLVQAGDNFSLAVTTPCATDAAIIVRFNHMPPIACDIGATAPGKTFKFEVQNEQCRRL